MHELEESFPRLLAGRYRLEAKIGQGGMGIVCRATDISMDRPVAVKLIRAIDGVDIDEEIANRFLREVRTTARVHHEHIVEVYDTGRGETGDLFFVMELLQGRSLAARLKVEPSLPPYAVVHIARQTCAGLKAAHTAGIIHRDIKPGNIMLVPRDGDSDFVKLLDFGVAKSNTDDAQTQLTRTGMLVGTVDYMAPEQIMGRGVDGRSDIYALGIVMYKMIAGKTPFREGGVPALINAHLNVIPQPLREIVAETPAALENVILRCLAKRPEDRYANADELAVALGKVLDPSDAGLMSLEYGDDDEDPFEAPLPTESHVVTTKNETSFDNATTKLGVSSQKQSVAQSAISVQRTAVMHRENIAPSSRSLQTEMAATEVAETRECAMCRTRNPLHARACIACGVSLEPDSQAAVRARVTPISVAHAPHGTPQPPPTSGAFPMGPTSSAPFAAGAPSSGSVLRAHARVPDGERESVWRRLLAWAGLRGR